MKRALLDADVSLSVVKEFISDVKDKAIGVRKLGCKSKSKIYRGCK